MRQARRIPWSQQAILFQTNIQSRPLETALRQAGVRYHLVGGQSFFDRREVRDFLGYLKALLNPNDDVSLLRIANVPARGLSDATMERLLAASQERNCSVFAAMKNPAVQATFLPKTCESIAGFVAFIERTRAALTESVAHLPLVPTLHSENETGGNVRPHPGPLPQEREEYPPVLGVSVPLGATQSHANSAWKTENCRQPGREPKGAGNLQGESFRAPLPGGKGQGERKSLPENTGH